MTDTQTEAREDRGEANARAWLASIRKMVAAQNAIEDTEHTEAREAAERAIQKSVLSVMVRDGWREAGAESDGPVEYEILLSTGGPACRIYGELDEHNEPTSAELQFQDWFTPWTALSTDDPSGTYSDEWLQEQADAQDDVLAFARCFYFGN